jgi:RsiW-degrading membrane proteinase PrsW (M82 family)
VQPPDQKKAARSNAQRARRIVGWLAIPLTVLMLYSTVNETVEVLEYAVPVGVVMLIMWVLGVLAIWGRIPTTPKG